MVKDNTNKNLPAFFIERELVDEYCKLNGSDIYGFLLDTVRLGINDFLVFIKTKGKVLEIRGDQKVILHGSSNMIYEFKPRVSRDGPNSNQEEPLIYATDDPDYAIFLAILDNKRTKGIPMVYYDQGQIKCSIDLDYAKFADGFNSGFVYLLDKSSFEENSAHHFTSPLKQVPLFAIPIQPRDLKTTVYIDKR